MSYKFKCIVLLFLIYSMCTFGSELIFLDNSVTNDTYIASNKENQIKIAFKLGVDDLKTKYPNCEIVSKVQVGRSDLLDIFKQADKIKSTSKKTFLVGLIHSSEALLAGKALQKTNVLALSSGAATVKLNNINNNFFSLANTTVKVASLIKQYTDKLKLRKVGVVYPGNSMFSRELVDEFSKKYESLSFSIAVDTLNLREIDKKSLMEADAVFVPGFIQQTLPIIKYLSEAGYNGIIIGSPNLARSKNDLDTYLKFLTLKRTKLHFVASWIEGETEKSIYLEKRFKKISNEEIMGTAVHTYDATVIAGEFLCSSKELDREGFLKHISKLKRSKAFLNVRDYTSMDKGHLESRLSIVSYDFNKRSFSVIESE